MSKIIKYFLILAVFVSVSALIVNYSKPTVEAFFFAKISEPLDNITLVKVPPKPKKPGLNLDTASALALKIFPSGREKVLYAQNQDKALAIASITKLMTALVTLQNTYDLSNTVTVTKMAASQQDVPTYGNLKEGESFTTEQLLHIMLFYSSNDAAFAFADSIGENGFINKMNNMAGFLKMKDTHYVNPTGLDPDGTNLLPNYSSLHDLTILVRYLLKNYPIVFQYTTEQGPYPIENGIQQVTIPENEVLIGGKTGYTDKAGGCMIVLTKDAKQNQYMYAVLGSKSPEDRIVQIQKLIDWTQL